MTHPRLFLTIVCVTLSFATPASGARLIDLHEQEALVMSGHGDTITRPFLTKGEWEMQWEKSGEWILDVFLVYLIQKTTGETVQVANLQGTSGALYIPEPGEYFLRITANGPWSFHIIELSR